MYCDKITFVLFTYNEEARVERAIRNFRPFGRVLVVDNLSTDRTRDLAVAAGAEVLEHRNPGWVEDEHTVAVVKAALRTPWVYWGYADEIVDRPTMDAMLEVIEAGGHSIVNIARKNYYYGAFTGSAYVNTLNRAFRKDAIDFTGNTIHRFGKETVPASAIKVLDPDRYYVHHFISNTAKAYVRTLDGYTDIEAERARFKAPWKMLLSIAKTYFVNYFLRGGRKAGRPGFYLAAAMAYYQLLLEMKIYEREQGLTTLTIEDRNNAQRDALLAELERGAVRP